MEQVIIDLRIFFFENQLKTNLMSGQASPPPLPSSPPPRDSPPPTSSSNPTPGTARLDMLLGELFFGGKYLQIHNPFLLFR